MTYAVASVDPIDGKYEVRFSNWGWNSILEDLKFDTYEQANRRIEVLHVEHDIGEVFCITMDYGEGDVDESLYLKQYR